NSGAAYREFRARSADSLLSGSSGIRSQLPPRGRKKKGADWLAPASARSDFEAAGTSVGFEGHHNCNGYHEQNFAPEQNVGPVEIAVPRSRGRSVARRYSDAGHEVITPARRRDQKIRRQPHDHDDHPEKNAELLGHGGATETNRDAEVWRDGIFLLVLGPSRLRKERRLSDGTARRGAARLANLAQDEEQILLAGQGSEQRAFRQRLELLRGYPEAFDEVMVVSNLIEDLALFTRRDGQTILFMRFHADEY